MSDFTMKNCRICAEPFPVTAEYFPVRKSSKDGFRNECHACNRDRLKNWRKNNPDKVQKYHDIEQQKINDDPQLRAKKNARALKWHHEHQERHRENGKRYYEINKSRIQAEHRNYAREKKHEATNRMYNWRKNNPFKARAAKQKRRAIEAQAEGSHTAQEIEAIYHAQHGKCFHCGIEFNGNFTEDHWMPLSRGGSNYASNIVLLCGSCNSSKHNKLPCEWDSRYCE